MSLNGVSERMEKFLRDTNRSGVFDGYDCPEPHTHLVIHVLGPDNPGPYQVTVDEWQQWNARQSWGLR